MVQVACIFHVINRIPESTSVWRCLHPVPSTSFYDSQVFREGENAATEHVEHRQPKNIFQTGNGFYTLALTAQDVLSHLMLYCGVNRIKFE